MTDSTNRSVLPSPIRGALRRWYLTLPVLVVVIGVLIPLIYLILRAFQAEPATLVDLVFRYRNGRLLFNTLTLTAGVLVVSSVIALPLAWLTTRVNLRGRLFFTILGVLPLAVPGYVMAYALLATTGAYGTLANTLGIVIPRLDGYDGALIALSLTTYPYLFLNLRTTFLGMDPKLEESARSLGASRLEVFFKIILPQLRPAFLAGGLLVGLHVLGDFGVVSLMRFDTFSYALYLQYTASYDRIYAAWLALILLGITLCALLLEAYLLKGLMFNENGDRNVDRKRLTNIGHWSWAGYAFGGLVAAVSVGIPFGTVLYWMVDTTTVNLHPPVLGQALWNSISVSIPAAFLAALLALPMAYIGVRYNSRWSRGLERVAYLGYATPRLAFALAWIVFVLAVLPVGYQTLVLLVLAYALHFLAEAIGPVRSALYQTPSSLEEAAQSLGKGPLKIFFQVIFPLVRRGLLVSVAFVFLSGMKELPLTLLLAPPGFQTLATNTWSFAEEAMFARAAPHALTIMMFSACFVWLLLQRD
ncbi:MAG: ABC transporter permease [bacterium]